MATSYSISTWIKLSRGFQFWADRSIFEGVFRFNDTVNGRYITRDGDVYVEEYTDSKPHECILVLKLKFIFMILNLNNNFNFIKIIW